MMIGIIRRGRNKWLIDKCMKSNNTIFISMGFIIGHDFIAQLFFYVMQHTAGMQNVILFIQSIIPYIGTKSFDINPCLFGKPLSFF